MIVKTMGSSRLLAYLCALCIGLLVGTACTASAEVRDSDLGLAFEAPADWEVERPGDSIIVKPPVDAADPADYFVLIMPLSSSGTDVLTELETLFRAPFGVTDPDKLNVLRPPQIVDTPHDQAASGVIEVDVTADDPTAGTALAPFVSGARYVVTTRMVVVRDRERLALVISAWRTYTDGPAYDLIADTIIGSLEFIPIQP